MTEVGKYLEEYSFEYFLDEALTRVPEDVDKREGSIIYDALAPACYELAELIFKLKEVVAETYTATASGEYLNLKGLEVGVERVSSTQAIVKASILKQDGTPVNVSKGDRFATVGSDQIIYEVIEKQVEGYYLLKCLDFGEIGNKYIGQLLPLQSYADMFEVNLVEITIPARNTETDESMRERILQAFQNTRFGGNVADYIRFTKDINGVGDCQVYPVWDGGGTVLVVIIDNNLELASDMLVDSVQNEIDPISPEGRGIAPIGHKVTVKTASRFDVSVSFELSLANNFSIEQVRPSIERKIEEYFKFLRDDWGVMQDDNSYVTWIFRSQLMSIVLGIQGVSNVKNLMLNGKDEDVLMTATPELQELPFLNEVVIYDN